MKNVPMLRCSIKCVLLVSLLMSGSYILSNDNTSSSTRTGNGLISAYNAGVRAETAVRSYKKGTHEKKELQLSGQDIISVDDIKNFTDTWNLNFITHLDLSHNMLPKVPDTLFVALPQLKELNLSHNNLTTFPVDKLPAHPTLKRLYLHNNKLFGKFSLGTLLKVANLTQLTTYENNISDYECPDVDNNTLEQLWLGDTSRIPSGKIETIVRHCWGLKAEVHSLGTEVKNKFDTSELLRKYSSVCQSVGVPTVGLLVGCLSNTSMGPVGGVAIGTGILVTGAGIYAVIKLGNDCLKTFKHEYTPQVPPMLKKFIVKENVVEKNKKKK